MAELILNSSLGNLQDRQDRLSKGVTKLKSKLKNANIPEAYKDSRCQLPNQWIYLYPDGHEELVEINTTSMVAKKLKEY
ncbi:hypothetical protein [Olivibacter sitiensis]|uniref:hypothetical protein n=1 Tax=Olivibacter sitiensis TaxID=376470 RepID=UPI0004156062|nr:hypothetical protein [Olivibacter sitiensis]